MTHLKLGVFVLVAVLINVSAAFSKTAQLQSKTSFDFEEEFTKEFQQDLVKSKQNSIRDILGKRKSFNQEMFNELLTTPKKDGTKKDHDRLPAMFLTDIQNLCAKLEKEFPEIIKVKTIGQSYQKRPITLLEVDARDFLVKEHYFNAANTKAR